MNAPRIPTAIPRRATLLLAFAAFAPLPVLQVSAHAQAARGAPAQRTAEAAPTWQREAVPFYDTVHALQGIYAHHAAPPRVLGDTVRYSFVRDPDGNFIEVSQRASLVGSIGS